MDTEGRHASLAKAESELCTMFGHLLVGGLTTVDDLRTLGFLEAPLWGDPSKTAATTPAATRMAAAAAASLPGTCECTAEGGAATSRQPGASLSGVTYLAQQEHRPLALATASARYSLSRKRVFEAPTVSSGGLTATSPSAERDSLTVSRVPTPCHRAGSPVPSDPMMSAVELAACDGHAAATIQHRPPLTESQRLRNQRHSIRIEETHMYQQRQHQVGLTAPDNTHEDEEASRSPSSPHWVPSTQLVRGRHHSTTSVPHVLPSCAQALSYEMESAESFPCHAPTTAAMPSSVHVPTAKPTSEVPRGNTALRFTGVDVLVAKEIATHLDAEDGGSDSDRSTLLNSYC